MDCEYVTKDLQEARSHKENLNMHFEKKNQKNVTFEIIKDGEWYMVYSANTLKKLEAELIKANILQRFE